MKVWRWPLGDLKMAAGGLYPTALGPQSGWVGSVRGRLGASKSWGTRWWRGLRGFGVAVLSLYAGAWRSRSGGVQTFYSHFEGGEGLGPPCPRALRVGARRWFEGRHRTRRDGLTRGIPSARVSLCGRGFGHERPHPF